MYINSLIKNLIDCKILLESVGELFWSKKIKSILVDGCIIDNLYKIDEIISWYGGMGSFSDLIISKQNGFDIGGESEENINDELHRLRSDIYQASVHIKRELL